MSVHYLFHRLKTSTHRANVQVIEKCEDLPAFCKEMCGKLQACPYLFGPTEITNQCPEQCHQANKLKFRMYKCIILKLNTISIIIMFTSYFNDYRKKAEKTWSSFYDYSCKRKTCSIRK